MALKKVGESQGATGKAGISGVGWRSGEVLGSWLVVIQLQEIILMVQLSGPHFHPGPGRAHCSLPHPQSFAHPLGKHTHHEWMWWQGGSVTQWLGTQAQEPDCMGSNPGFSTYELCVLRQVT